MSSPSLADYSTKVSFFFSIHDRKALNLVELMDYWGSDKISRMNNNRTQVSYGPCPPHEFAGRSDERKGLLEALSQAKHRGQFVMVSGARGSGKTSFVDWAECMVQNEKGGLGTPAIKKYFLETPGMVFTTYRDLLADLKGYRGYGWFRKVLASPRVAKSIGVALDVLERASSLAGPAKVGVDLGTTISRGFLPGKTVEYSQLLSSLISVLNALSDELTKKNRILVILVDDVQWSSEPDFRLMKDLIRNLPRAIACVASFRLETESMMMYVELRGELDRYGHAEIRLSGMSPEEVKDLARLRYRVAIDNSVAEFLSMNVGDPFCLVSCFNLLQERGFNLPPSLSDVEKILPEAIDPVRCIYSELDELWKDRLDSLCVLRPPLSLSLIACMLRTEEKRMARLQDELNQSVLFRNLEKEFYEFAHPSLREFRRKELPEGVLTRLHAQAAKCLETLKGRFPEESKDISLAEHYFFGQEHEKALDLNLQLGDRLYDLFDYGLALELTERAGTCAEETNDKDKLAHSFHQKGTILHSMFRFPDSLDAYNQCLEIAREIGNRAGEASTLHQIGIVYESTNHPEQALDAYNQSLEIEREIGDRAGEASTLHQIGMVYQSTNHPEQALDFYNQSLEIERETGNRAGEEISLQTIRALEEEMSRKRGR